MGPCGRVAFSRDLKPISKIIECRVANMAYSSPHRLLLLALLLLHATRATRLPHIVFFLADDYGFGDVGYHAAMYGNDTNRVRVQTPYAAALIPSYAAVNGSQTVRRASLSSLRYHGNSSLTRRNCHPSHSPFSLALLPPCTLYSSRSADRHPHPGLAVRRGGPPGKLLHPAGLLPDARHVNDRPLRPPPRDPHGAHRLLLLRPAAERDHTGRAPA